MSTLLMSFNALTVNADDEYTDSMLSFGKDSLESASYSVSNTKEYWWNSELEVATMGAACGYRLTLFYVPDTLSADFEDSDDQHEWIKNHYSELSSGGALPVYYLFNKNVVSKYGDDLYCFLQAWDPEGGFTENKLLRSDMGHVSTTFSCRVTNIMNSWRNLTTVANGAVGISESTAKQLFGAFNWDSQECSFDMSSVENILANYFKDKTTKKNLTKHISTTQQNLVFYMEPMVCMGIDIYGYQDSNGNSVYDSTGDKYGLNKKFLLTPSDVARIYNFNNLNTGGTALFNATDNFVQNFMRVMDPDGVSGGSSSGGTVGDVLSANKGAIAWSLAKEAIIEHDTIWETIPTIRYVENFYDAASSSVTTQFAGGATIDKNIWNDIVDVLKYAKRITDVEPTSSLYSNIAVKQLAKDVRDISKCAYKVTASGVVDKSTYKEDYKLAYQGLWSTIIAQYGSTPANNFNKSTTTVVDRKVKFNVGGIDMYGYSGVNDPSTTSVTLNAGEEKYKMLNNAADSFGTNAKDLVSSSSSPEFNISGLTVGELLRNPYKYFIIIGQTDVSASTGLIARPVVVLNDENSMGYSATYATIKNEYFDQFSSVLSYIRNTGESRPGFIDDGSFNSSLRDKINEARRCLEYLNYFELGDGWNTYEVYCNAASHIGNSAYPDSIYSYNQIICKMLYFSSHFWLNTSSHYWEEHDNGSDIRVEGLNWNVYDKTYLLNQRFFDLAGNTREDNQFILYFTANDPHLVPHDAYNLLINAPESEFKKENFDWYGLPDGSIFGDTDHLKDVIIEMMKDAYCTDYCGVRKPYIYINEVYNDANNKWHDLQKEIYDGLCNYYDSIKIVDGGSLNTNSIGTLLSGARINSLETYDLEKNYNPFTSSRAHNTSWTISGMYKFNNIPGTSNLLDRSYKMYVYDLSGNFSIPGLKNAVTSATPVADLTLGELFRNPQKYGISYDSKGAENFSDIIIEPWAYLTDTVQAGPGISSQISYTPSMTNRSIAFIENNGTPEHSVNTIFHNADNYLNPEFFDTWVTRRAGLDDNVAPVSSVYTLQTVIDKMTDKLKVNSNFNDELIASGVPARSDLTIPTYTANTKPAQSSSSDTVIPTILKKRDTHNDVKELAKFNLKITAMPSIPSKTIPSYKQFTDVSTWTAKAGNRINRSDTTNKRTFEFYPVYPVTAISEYRTNVVISGIPAIVENENPVVLPAHNMDILRNVNNTAWCYANNTTKFETYRSISASYNGVVRLSGDWSTDRKDIDTITSTKAPVAKAGEAVVMDIESINNYGPTTYKNQLIIDIFDTVSLDAFSTEFTSKGITETDFYNEIETIKNSLTGAKFEIASTLSGISTADKNLGVQYTDITKEGDLSWISSGATSVSVVYEIDKVDGRFGSNTTIANWHNANFTEVDLSGTSYGTAVQSRVYAGLYQRDWIYTDFEGLGIAHAKIVVNFGNYKGALRISDYESDSLDTDCNSRYLSQESSIDAAWKAKFGSTIYNANEMNAIMPYIDLSGCTEASAALNKTYIPGGITNVNVYGTIR